MAEDKRALIADCVKEMHDLVMNLPYLYDSQLAESFQMIERIDKINRKTKRVVRALRKYAFARGWSILMQMGNAIDENDAMDNTLQWTILYNQQFFVSWRESCFISLDLHMWD
eukprot:654206_1